MPAIDWGNSLTSGLKFCFDGTAVEQIGNNSIASQLDAEAQIATASDGRGELVLTGAQAAGQVSYAVGEYNSGIVGAAGVTIDLLVKFDDFAVNYSIFGKWGAATQRYNYLVSNRVQGIQFAHGSPAVSNYYGIDATTNTADLLTAGQYHHIVIAWSNGASPGEPGTPYVKIYVDCEDQPLTVISTPYEPVGFVNDTWNRLMLGNDEEAISQLPGGIKLARMWGRKLTVAEIALLCADPYRIFSTAKKQEAGRAIPDGCSEDDPNCRPKSARDRKQRRRIIVNDRVYWATDSELPGLLKALLTQPPKPQKPRKRAQEKAKAKPAYKGRALQEIVPAVELAPLPDLGARYRAMLVQFQAKQDEEAISALRVAYAKEIEDDEHDIETLILGL